MRGLGHGIRGLGREFEDGVAAFDGLQGFKDRVAWGREAVIAHPLKIADPYHHLGELRRLIRARKADFIEEFDPERWPPPPPGAPVVEQIEIVITRTAD